MAKKVTPKEEPRESISLNPITRGIISAVFFIFGFNFAYGAFFKDNPLYGVPYLAEVLISLVAALAGYYIVPQIIHNTKKWIEKLIIDTVTEIVGNFWEQQTTRINNRKRQKQRKLAAEKRRKHKKELEESVVVDTSVLVDGRILGLVTTGFFKYNLVIPGAVKNELHLISDSNDKLKRERGRRGLDIINELKKQTRILSPNIKTKKADVDNILMDFAKKNKLRLMTLDFNLNKRAKASGVQVLNINELVEAIKVSVLPGEIMDVTIVQKGKEKKQGVGYMPDGTMIVVEDAKDLMDTTQKVKVARVIQSPAGQIIFTDLV